MCNYPSVKETTTIADTCIIYRVVNYIKLKISNKLQACVQEENIMENGNILSEGQKLTRKNY